MESRILHPQSRGLAGVLFVQPCCPLLSCRLLSIADNLRLSSIQPGLVVIIHATFCAKESFAIFKMYPGPQNLVHAII